MKIFSSTMAEETKNRDIPSVVISAPESSSKRSYKKYAIIAGSVVLGVAIILTAILVGMYLFSETQKEIVKFSYNRVDNSKMDVESNPNANTVQYHVKNEAFEGWAFNDFNKDITVMKIKKAESTNCYVSLLNRTIAPDPSKITPPTETTVDMPKYHVRYVIGDNPISDVSFLYKAARDACKGISTYWMYPKCNDSPDNNSRMKRGGCPWFCFFACFC